MNITYKKIIPFVALALLLSANGCKKSNLDSELLSQLEPQTALTSVAAMKAAIAGIGANVRREFTGDMAPIVTESIF